MAAVGDRSISGPNGKIPIRIYSPAGPGPFPILVFYHGGGWVLGNLDSADGLCRFLTNAAGCVLVSVNYSHAPEHKFPVPAEDAYTGAQWVAQNATSLNGDATRIAVGGMSSGGNLAAAVALMARDRGTPAISFQMLVVPVLDPNFETASYRENAEGYGLTNASMQWFWGQDLADPADSQNPYASPLRAKSLKNLPPALLLTAEFDVMRDEGDAYAARLKADAVPTQYICYPGMVHAFLGPQANPDMARALRRAFARNH